MSATIGGRIQAEPVQPWTTPLDRGLLVILLTVAVAVHAWLIAHTFVTGRDGIGFARYALNLNHPPAGKTPVDVIRDAQHPPGYPLAVLGVSKLVGVWSPVGVPERMLLAAQIAAAIGGVLVVLPMYAIGRMLLGPFAGFAGALLFQVLPLPARVTSDGLTDGPYLFLVASAVAFGVWGLRSRSVGGFLLCGGFCGLSYLVRPEGLMAAFAVGVAVVTAVVTRRWPFMVAAGRVVALSVGLMLTAGPYVALIGGISNKPGSNDLWTRIKTAIKQRQEALGATGAKAAPVPLFAAWYSPDKDGPVARWAATTTVNETVQALHYAPAVFAVIGLWAVRRRLLAEPELLVVPVLIAVNVGVMYIFALHRGYLSGRHTLLVGLLGCVLAGRGIEIVAEGLAGKLPYKLLCGLLLAALVGAAVPAAMKPPHEHRMGHYFAGKYLATVGLDRGKDTVVDPFEWAMFYGGWSLTDIPDDNGDDSTVYVVMEENTSSPHSRLPRYETAVTMKKGGVPVYHYPPDGPLAEAKVVVYRVDRKK